MRIGRRLSYYKYWNRPVRRVLLSSLPFFSSLQVNCFSLLVQPSSIIQQAYQQGETDGILALVQRQPDILLETCPEELIDVTISATETLDKPKAAAAGIWNAWLGACYLLHQPHKAKMLWHAMEERRIHQNDNNVYIAPDIVTYSLVYQATCNDDDTTTFADNILQQCLQSSKKNAVSKRRKAINVARRESTKLSSTTENPSTVETQELETKLQEIFQDNDLSVLENTKDYLILSKPSGVTCYHTTTTTAGKISKKNKKKNVSNNKQRDISLEDAILHCQIPLSTINYECLGLVHRIDRGTSGCIIWAKNNEIHTYLVTQFFLRHVQKQYIGLVSPTPTQFKQLDKDIEIDKNDKPIEVNIPVQGHPAVSKISMLERYPSNQAAMLQIEPKTGRQHQVRIHCAHGLKTPIISDPLYSTSTGDSTGKTTKSSSGSSNTISSSLLLNLQKQEGKHSARTRFFLHASSLTIPSLDIHVQAPIPEWWSETIATLKEEPL